MSDFNAKVSDVVIKADETGKHRPPVMVEGEGLMLACTRYLNKRQIGVVGPFPADMTNVIDTYHLISEGTFHLVDIAKLEAEVREQIEQYNLVLFPGPKALKARAAAQVAPETPQVVEETPAPTPMVEEPVVEVAPEPVAEPAPAPVVEPEVEVASEPTPEPVDEVTEALREICQLYGALSPENLTCDGELSKTAVKQRAGRINSKLKELQKRIGKQVTEDMAYALSAGRITPDDLPPFYAKDRVKWEKARQAAKETPEAPEAPQGTPEAEQPQEEAPETPESKPLPEVGARVRFSYNGEELTGTVEKQEDGTNIFQVAPDAPEYNGFFRLSTDQMQTI